MPYQIVTEEPLSKNDANSVPIYIYKNRNIDMTLGGFTFLTLNNMKQYDIFLICQFYLIHTLM